MPHAATHFLLSRACWKGWRGQSTMESISTALSGKNYTIPSCTRHWQTLSFLLLTSSGCSQPSFPAIRFITNEPSFVHQCTSHTHSHNKYWKSLNFFFCYSSCSWRRTPGSMPYSQTYASEHPLHPPISLPIISKPKTIQAKLKNSTSSMAA